jgi:hypothetical protein
LASPGCGTREKNYFGMRIEISEGDSLLDTGGGLKKAAWFFREEGPAAPFFLHNVDAISSIDLRRMLDFHTQNQALATLAVQQRSPLSSLICGWQAQERGLWLIALTAITGATWASRKALHVPPRI